MRVERAIYDELHRLCQQHGVRLLVAVLSSQLYPNTMTGPIMQRVRELGIEAADISLPAGTPELDQRYQQVPGSDRHPTAAGHRRYAEQLLPLVQR